MKKCRNLSCNNLIELNNRSPYCNKSCYKKSKRERQKIVDQLVKYFRKGVYRNYKLFIDLIQADGFTRIPIEEAYKRGFDEHAYYGTAKDEKGGLWYYVEKYCFNLEEENDIVFLNLYKQ